MPIRVLEAAMNPYELLSITPETSPAEIADHFEELNEATKGDFEQNLAVNLAYQSVIHGENGFEMPEPPDPEQELLAHYMMMRETRRERMRCEPAPPAAKSFSPIGFLTSLIAWAIIGAVGALMALFMMH
jgi:hypothetical protein